MALESEECKRISTSATNDDALVLGVLAALSGPHAGFSSPTVNGIDLALKDLQTATGGLPPASSGGARRPLAYVLCDDQGDLDLGFKASQHLIDLGLPVIIGPSICGGTIAIAQKVTIPGGALMISPSETSPSLAMIAQGRELVHRTVPSDVLAMRALNAIVGKLEEAIRAKRALGATDKINAAIVRDTRECTDSLGASLARNLVINGELSTYGQDHFVNAAYTAADGATVGEAVRQILKLGPEIVVGIGMNELINQVLPAIEDGWPQGKAPPIYVLSSGTFQPELAKMVFGRPEASALHRRIVGITYGPTNKVFDRFAGRYQANVMDHTSPEAPGASSGYDAVLIASLAAASVVEKAWTGATLAAGLARITPDGTRVLGLDEIAKGLSLMQDQTSQVAFQGTSAYFDFRPNSPDPVSDVQIWCFPPSAGSKPPHPLWAKTIYFDGRTNVLVGGTDELRNACDIP